MDIFTRAQWIWLPGDCEADSYGEFARDFSWEQGKAVCRISCDGDYALYINGNLASFWQYGDYEHYKVYDSIDVTPYLQKGKNRIAVRVWHYGESSQRYIAAQSGLLFEVVQDDAVLTASDEAVLCRKSPAFISGEKKWITVQMGFTFSYDAAAEDNWLTGEMQYGKNAALVEKHCRLVPNPVQKMKLLPKADATVLKMEKNYLLIDLGKETVGIPVLEFVSQTPQQILVQWGEDLQNGHVRRLIENRDFSFTYRAKTGENQFENPLLRIGCRFLEVITEQPITALYFGVRPVQYPVDTMPFALSDPLDHEIYDTCVSTLKCCLMDHYVDTPWREQCLYAFDARNQMLCGYYAFADQNAAYARANLKLIAQDRREDGLLAITYPCGVDLTIPSFSLFWVKAVREYMTHTADVSLGVEVYPKLRQVMDVFHSQWCDGLILRFSGKNHWNFYDWSPCMEGNLHGEERSEPDLMLGCLFLIALQELSQIEKMIGQASDSYQGIMEKTRFAIRNAFLNEESGFFFTAIGENRYTALGNAMAVLAGVTNPDESCYICQHLLSEELIECSLSMKTFLYDAMIQTDRKAFAPVVLDRIRGDYGKMLDAGTTTVWETADGASAFNNAGSLCHGWSAIPIYYYQLLLQYEGIDAVVNRR